VALTAPSQADTLTVRLGYEPRDRALFVVALTHRSAEGPNNERLEFLGDSVLNLLLSERLYREFSTASEGDLSRLRARLVSDKKRSWPRCSIWSPLLRTRPRTAARRSSFLMNRSQLPQRSWQMMQINPT
jgi:hypothetical protein